MPDVVSSQERNSPERQRLYIESQELIHEYPGNLHCFDDFPGASIPEPPITTEKGEIIN